MFLIKKPWRRLKPLKSARRNQNLILILLFLIVTEACILLSGPHILPEITKRTEEILQTDFPATFHAYGISLDIENKSITIYRTEESAASVESIAN